MKTLLSVLFCLAVAPAVCLPIKWSTYPVVLSTPGVNAVDPQVAMDASGNLVAVWVENNTVLAKTRPTSGNWSVAVVLSSAMASSPRVVIDPSGNATAMWIDSDIVTTATRPYNDMWGTPTTLSGSGASDPSLSVDASGNVVAVWTRNGTVQSATKFFNNNWPYLPNKISITGVPSDTAQVAMGDNGTVVAVWHGLENSIDTIYAATKTVNSDWSVAQAISKGDNSVNPSVAVSSDGQAVAVWYTYSRENANYYSDVTVQASTLAVDGSWETPVTLTNKSGLTNPQELMAKVRYDNCGNVVAVWNLSFDGEIYTLQSAVRPVSSQWTAPVDVESGFYVYSEDLSVDTNGNALLAFMDGDTQSIVVKSTELNVSAITPNQWAKTANIASGSGNGYPRITSIVNGKTIHAASLWLNAKQGITSIQAVTGTGSIFLPPKNPKVVQTMTNYTLFKDYVNTVSWQASTDPNLTGYAIYRNGEMIGTVGAKVLSFVDHNRDPLVADTYGIAAFGQGSEQSSIVTVTFP